MMKGVNLCNMYNKIEYNKQYNKSNYKQFKASIKPDLFERINKYCADMGISKADFLRRAIDMLEDI